MEDKNKPVVNSKKDIEKSDAETFFPLSPFKLFTNPMFSFQYSRQVFTFFENTTSIYAEKHKYENGKLESESFKGTLPGNPFSESIEMLQQQMINQAEIMFKGFQSLLGIK